MHACCSGPEEIAISWHGEEGQGEKAAAQGTVGE